MENNSITGLFGSIDTIEHFYFECEKTKLFWNNIRIWITDINIDFLQENIHTVFGNYNILHAKSYIYNCKNKQKDLLPAIEFFKKLK